jgi:uncharacterized protein (UPF0335 family)
MAARKTPRRAPAAPKTEAPKADEVPVTAAMLRETRTELLERIDQAKSELRAEFAELRAEVHSLRADVHGMRAEIARIGLLVEEQNARNKIVLDGLMAYIDRQNRLEKRMDTVEETVRKLAAA